MKKKNDENVNENNFEITDKLQSIGLNLSLVSTLINFLEYGVSDNLNFTNKDIENLIIVMRKIILTTIKEHDEIELSFDI